MSEDVADQLDPVARLLAAAQCQELMLEYARRLDHGFGSTVFELFTEDGEWSSPTIHCIGHDQMREFFTRRDRMRERVTRHVVVNISVSLQSHDRASGHSIAIEYRSDRGASGLAEVTAPALVGDYEDVFHRVDGIWLFRSRRALIDFRRAGEEWIAPSLPGSGS